MDSGIEGFVDEAGDGDGLSGEENMSCLITISMAIDIHQYCPFHVFNTV